MAAVIDCCSSQRNNATLYVVLPGSGRHGASERRFLYIKLRRITMKTSSIFKMFIQDESSERNATERSLAEAD